MTAGFRAEGWVALLDEITVSLVELRLDGKDGTNPQVKKTPGMPVDRISGREEILYLVGPSDLRGSSFPTGGVPAGEVIYLLL
jgi:hypothetical protein